MRNDSRQTTPHSKAKTDTDLTTGRNTWKRTSPFWFLSVPSDRMGETNPRRSESGGAQTEERSCWGWHFGHEPSTLGKQMKDDEREKNDDDKTKGKRKQARQGPPVNRNWDVPMISRQFIRKFQSLRVDVYAQSRTFTIEVKHYCLKYLE